jgi:hypothetical protein
MEERSKLLSKYSAKQNLGESLSINDIRDKEFSGEPLTQREKQALHNFDCFRLAELNATKDDMSFHQRYRELQVMANLGDYEEFLKDKYFV